MERLNFSDTSGFNKLSIGDTIVWVKENRIHGWDITSVFLKVINVTVPQNGFFKNQIGNVKVQLGNNQICDLFFYNGYNRTYTVSNDVRGYARHVSGLGKRMECI